jgi:lysophospholipase L1-like esterase
MKLAEPSSSFSLAATIETALETALVVLALAAVACSSPSKPTPTPPAAPTIACPLETSGTSTDGKMAVVTFAQPQATGGSPPLTIACNPTSGSSFPVGATTVTCTATDTLSRQATCSFSVKVSPPPPRLRVTTFLAFGDSLTEGKPAMLDYNEFPGSYRIHLDRLLKERYTAQTPITIPAGVAGEPAAKAKTRLKTELALHRPQAVLLMEGANDIKSGDVEAAAAAVRDLVEIVTDSGAVCLLATLPPQIAGLPRADGAAYVVPFNEKVRTIALREGAILVDVWAAFGGKANDLVGIDGHRRLAPHREGIPDGGRRVLRRDPLTPRGPHALTRPRRRSRMRSC